MPAAWKRPIPPGCSRWRLPYELKNVLVTSYNVVEAGQSESKGPTLNAKGGSDVAMEEVTLGYTEVEWTY